MDKSSIMVAEIKSGEIESFIYRGGYILTKDELINYLVKTSNDKGRTFVVRSGK